MVGQRIQVRETKADRPGPLSAIDLCGIINITSLPANFLFTIDNILSSAGPSHSKTRTDMIPKQQPIESAPFLNDIIAICDAGAWNLYSSRNSQNSSEKSPFISLILTILHPRRHCLRISLHSHHLTLGQGLVVIFIRARRISESRIAILRMSVLWSFSMSIHQHDDVSFTS